MQVRREIVLEAPVEDVWEAITDPEQLGEWFANEVELDVREGGEGRFRYAPDHPRYQAVLRHLGGLRPGETKPVPPWDD